MMFGVVNIKVEPMSTDSSDDETLVKYATRVKLEPLEDKEPFREICKAEPLINQDIDDYEPDLGDYLSTELTNASEGDEREQTNGKRPSCERVPRDGDHSAEAESGAKCDICGGVYRSKQGLSAHKKRIHFKEYLKKAKRTGECALCHKKYVNWKSLQTHMNKMHLKDNGRGHQFKCEDCGMVFRIRNSLWMHRYHKHLNLDLRTTCKYCGRVLKTPRSHRDHLKKKHPREYLSSKVAAPVDEEEAIVIVRPHKCDLCERRYTALSALRKHVATVHAPPQDERACADCGRQFKTEARLVSHMEATHSSVADLRKCARCGLIYKNKYSLQHHMTHKHGERSPLGAGAPCTPEEARRYSRRPQRALPPDPLLPPRARRAEYILP